MTRVTSPLETTVCSLEMILAWVSLPAGEVGKSMRGISKPLISSSQVLTLPGAAFLTGARRGMAHLCATVNENLTREGGEG